MGNLLRFNRHVSALFLGAVLTLLSFQNCDQRSLSGQGDQSSQSQKCGETSQSSTCMASLYVAVDNSAFIYLNQKKIGSVFAKGDDNSEAWQKAQVFQVPVVKGDNVLAILAINDSKTLTGPGGGPAALLVALDLGNGNYLTTTNSTGTNWKVSPYYTEDWNKAQVDETLVDANQALVWQTPRVYGFNGESTTTWSAPLLASTGSYFLQGFPTQVAGRVAYAWSANNSHDADGKYAENLPVDNLVYFRLKFSY